MESNNLAIRGKRHFFATVSLKNNNIDNKKTAYELFFLSSFAVLSYKSILGNDSTNSTVSTDSIITENNKSNMYRGCLCPSVI